MKTYLLTILFTFFLTAASVIEAHVPTLPVLAETEKQSTNVAHIEYLSVGKESPAILEQKASQYLLRYQKIKDVSPFLVEIAKDTRTDRLSALATTAELLAQRGQFDESFVEKLAYIAATAYIRLVKYNQPDDFTEFAKARVALANVSGDGQIQALAKYILVRSKKRLQQHSKSSA